MEKSRKKKKPRLQRHEHVVAYDVDNTLVTPAERIDGLVVWDYEILNPYTGTIGKYRVHRKHVELLKAHKGRGKHVRVWSAAGNKWAEAVCIALDIIEYVDSIETKPELLIDDLPVHEIFPARIYLKE